MVDQLSTINPQLEDAEIISAARGGVETLFVILQPHDISIGESFDLLRDLEVGLAKFSPAVQMRSLNAFDGQLRLYGLDREEPVQHLLAALSENRVNTLVSADGSMFGVVVSAPVSIQRELLQYLRAWSFDESLGVVEILAAVALEQDVAAGLRADLRLLIPSIVAVMLLMLLVAFGHWRALILPAFASIASSIVVFSLLSIAGIAINLVTLLALPIVLIVALANSCHFLAKSSMAISAGGDLQAAVSVTIRRIAAPYLISSLTTAVALASLGFNEIAPIRELGLLAAGSLVVSFVLIMLAAPWALFRHLRSSLCPMRESRLYRAFSGGIFARRKPISAMLVLASVVSLAAAFSLEVRSDARVFFPDDARFTKAFRVFEERFYVFTPLRLLVTPASESMSPLETLRASGRIRDRLVSLEGVRNVAVSAAAGDNGSFLVTAILSDDSATAEIAGHIDALRDEVAGDFKLVYSSAQLVYEGIDQQALSSLAASLTTSLLIIFGVIALLFRSLQTLGASLAANAVPLLLVCGAIWLVGDPLNLVTAFVFLVALGVIVDDTIHILYQHEKGDSLSGSSIEFSVVLSTIMLCLGLLLCQMSDFPTTRQFAAYCALTLAAAVASDLTLLPRLLDRRNLGQNR